MYNCIGHVDTSISVISSTVILPQPYFTWAWSLKSSSTDVGVTKNNIKTNVILETINKRQNDNRAQKRDNTDNTQTCLCHCSWTVYHCSMCFISSFMFLAQETALLDTWYRVRLARRVHWVHTRTGSGRQSVKVVEPRWPPLRKELRQKINASVSVSCLYVLMFTFRHQEAVRFFVPHMLILLIL